MIFVLILVVIFILVSIYFYFRAEKLQQELRVIRREFTQSKKDSKAIADKMALVASRHEEFAKFRLKLIQECKLANKVELEKQIQFIAPLINNYGAIFRACSSSKDQLKPMSEKCFEGLNPGSYNGFVTYINGKEAHIRKMWSSNNLIGFISLVEALLIDLNKTVESIEKKQNNTMA
ncbi:hypothetical protein [Thalassotalea atypica]|uniref:hypothetical protein n=1 Tax=Thalassotalea atypica TaxID=2054316 RepID=UPI002573DB62|nr:hypothetical protein [Thalassotalea atypica]